MRNSILRAATIFVIAITGLGLSGLAGCENTPEQRQAIATLTLAEACQAYASALRVLTPLRAAGELSADEIATVDRANTATDQVCVGEPPADPVEAVARVNSAVTMLMLTASRNGG